jgi:hypothetical protein
LWATAVVAAGSAIGGALIGGYVSYRGNLRLSNAQRRVRAAVRRKAKVYVPLKLELHQLQSSLDQDQHLRWGIDLGEGPARRPKGTPVFELWRGLVEDGRASFATSDEVRKRLKALAQTVEVLGRSSKPSVSRFTSKPRATTSLVPGSIAIRWRMPFAIQRPPGRTGGSRTRRGFQTFEFASMTHRKFKRAEPLSSRLIGFSGPSWLKR